MQGGKGITDIFLHLIIFMGVNVHSQSHRSKGLSTYDIELWYRMRGTGNNSGTYNSSNLVDVSKGYEKSLRRYYYQDEKPSEDSDINYDEMSKSMSQRSGKLNRRFFYSLDDYSLFCDYFVDCDESEDSDEIPSSTSRPWQTTSSSLRPIVSTESVQFLPQPESTRPQPTPTTLAPYSSETPMLLPIPDTEHYESTSESIPISINDITILAQEHVHLEIPHGYYQYQYSPNAYKFHTEEVCWLDARSRCRMESAQLVVIENGAQYDIVVRIGKQIMGDTVGLFHIGFQHQLGEFPWITVYGDRLPFEKWATCPVNDTIENTNCGGFIVGPNHLDGLISYPCDRKYAYMCEIKIPSNCS